MTEIDKASDAENDRKPIELPGRLGVWAGLDGMSAPQAAEFAQQVEGWGYSILWTPEAVGRDPFALIGYLAAHTSRLAFATGIANIYARDAVAYKALLKTLAEMLPGRFILGLGVSHKHLVSSFRGHEWEKPVTKMRQVLAAIDSARYMGREPEIEAPIVLAALRPRMLELARDQTRGAHPYLVTPEHTRRAREILGDGPWLCPEQMVILETDADKARAIARQQLQVYLRAPNYQNSLIELGFTDEDWNAPSDGVLDALVAWGDEDALQQRIQEHWDAGADHVCIQPFRPDGTFGPHLEALACLAPAGRTTVAPDTDQGESR